MASQLRVNKSENRSGLGTITYTDTGAIVSGIVTANSFSGDIIGDITGAVTATTGSFSGDVSIAEKIIHTGDTNTFMKFGTDTVTFETAGDERIRIASDGKIGIGTDNPNNPLTVHASGNHIYLKDTATNNILQIRHASGVAEFNTFGTGGARKDYVFNQYTSEVLRITSAGVIQCKGETDVLNNILRVTDGAPKIIMSVPSGGLDTRLFNDGSGNFIIGHGDNSDTPTERLRIGSNGSVGIGTDNLSNNAGVYNKLTVDGDTTSQIGVAKIVRRHTNGSSGTYTLEVDSSSQVSNVTSSGAMSVTVNNGRAFTINALGNVSIANELPRSRLDVFETVTGTQTAIRIGNTNTPSSANDKRLEFVDGTGTTEGTNKFTYGYIQGVRAGGANSGDLIFGTKRSNGAAPVEAMRIDDSGRIGINNNSPNRTVNITSATGGNCDVELKTSNNTGWCQLIFSDTDAAYRGGIAYEHQNNYMAFYTGAQDERMRIHSGGEVSINSTAKYDDIELYVNNFVRLGNFFIGRVPGTSNNSTGVVLIGRVGLNFGLHFSGQITFNSYTGTGTRILDITTTYNDNSDPFAAGASGELYSSGNVSRVNLKVCIGTVDSSVTESGNDETWLCLRKNGNGTGTAQLNAFIQTNAYSHGGIREIASGKFTQTQSIADFDS